MDPTLLRIGGVSAILLALCQAGGIVMHGALPMEPAETLAFVRDHVAWDATHVVLIASYAFLVAFYVGLAGAFSHPRPGGVRVGEQLVLVGAVLGAVHFLAHLGVFPHAAEAWLHADAAGRHDLELTTMAYHMYAHVLNRFSLLAMMLTAILFGVALARGAVLRRWLGISGVVTASVTIVNTAVVEIALHPPARDLVFAIGLLPTLTWVAVIGVAMLRVRRPVPLEAP